MLLAHVLHRGGREPCLFTDREPPRHGFTATTLVASAHLLLRPIRDHVQPLIRASTRVQRPHAFSVSGQVLAVNVLATGYPQEQPSVT